MADEQDDILKARVAKLLKLHYLGSYINMEIVNKIVEQAKQENIKQIIATSDEGEE